jgi:hypothetical protein
MTDERLEKFLRNVPEYLHKFYDGSSRGYYDKEKYRHTAKADRRPSQPEDQAPPQH